MKFNNYSKMFVLDDGAKLLMYLEHDGDNTIVHHVMWPDHVGTIDLKVTFASDDIDEVFENATAETATLVYESQLKELLESIPTGEDDDSDNSL